MFKKSISLLLACFLVFALCSCSKEPEKETVYINEIQYINNYRSLNVSAITDIDLNNNTNFYLPTSIIISDDLSAFYYTLSGVFSGRKTLGRPSVNTGYYHDYQGGDKSIGYIDIVIIEVRVYSDFALVYYDVRVAYDLLAFSTGDDFKDRNADNPKRIYLRNCMTAVSLSEKYIRIGDELYF